MNKKPTAEEVTQIERLMQKVVQKEISVIEAAQTILRNREAHANNAVEEYKEGLIKKIEPLFNYVDGKELKMEWKDKMVPVVEFNELLEILNKD